MDLMSALQKAALVTTLLLLLPIVTAVAIRRKKSGRSRKSVVIIVLGEIAQSPRMMRHALSFADHQWHVSLVAYAGSKPPTSLIRHPYIRLVPLNQFPDRLAVGLPRFLFVLFIAPLKVLYLSACLVSKLLFHGNNQCSFIMVQNPPAMPTLPIVQLAKLLLGSKLIIDWHNTAHSILALKLGSEQHFLVRLLKWTESKFGKFASLHLFVTEAEKVHLSESWDLKGRKKVFYDRPPRSFRRLTIPEIHSFILRSPLNSHPILNKIFTTGRLPSETIMTYEDPGTRSYQFKPDRAALLVSSTSWTIDEDFNVLIDALSAYVKFKKGQPSLPKIMCLITGKGPMKEYYQDIIRERSQIEGWAELGICCQSIWFEDLEDYRNLLGSADLGISLHQSSSGLDLPMKVVDMFGCELPVCARNFKCLNELVKQDQNGLVFDSATQLASLLQELLISFDYQHNPANQETKANKLEDLRRGIQTTVYGHIDSNNNDTSKNNRSTNKDTTGQCPSFNRWACWEDLWEEHVLKYLESLL